MSGSYQTTGQTISVWLSPWPQYFTLVIAKNGCRAHSGEQVLEYNKYDISRPDPDHVL